jgi:PAS domain S-box-containing protein
MALSDPNLPDCPLVYVNPAFTELTGYDAEAAVGRNCRFLQGPETDPDAVQRISQAIRERRSLDEEIYNYRRDGSGFWNALYVSPVFDDDGTLIYFFASQIDVSARRESIRRQTQRMESMSALASGVAHEFNNLLTVVLGSLERAAVHAVDENQKRYLERADWGAKRAGQLAGELLSLARREANVERMTDLNQVIRDFEGTLAQLLPRGVQISCDLAPVPVLVRVDAAQLELVLLNLVRNAADAMPAGGHVSMTTSVLSASKAASTLNGREVVELVVADTGEGMSPEIVKRATELFFTTKASGKGTGLGLFLALEFVDKSGGRLTIDSQVGLGTKMRLAFPRATEP